MDKSDLQRKVRDFVTKVHTTLVIDQTVDEALRDIRKNTVHDKILYFYVINSAGHLKGVVSTRNLLLSTPETLISQLMEPGVVYLSENQTIREALELLSNHRLLAVPVVDLEQKLLGAIDIQLYLNETLDLAKVRRHSTDLFQVLGLTLEEGKPHSLWQTYKIRMPWIFCNIAGGITCAIISDVFELVLSSVLLLAFFIPLVLTLSEAIAMQSMTYSLQLLHHSHLTLKNVLFRLSRESRMVLFLGITSGSIAGLLSLFWGEGIHPALAIASGLIITITFSGLIGATIPLILHRLRLDPKVAAGPVALMIVDVITTSIYLSLASAWLI